MKNVAVRGVSVGEPTIKLPNEWQKILTMQCILHSQMNIVWLKLDCSKHSNRETLSCFLSPSTDANYTSLLAGPQSQ